MPFRHKISYGTAQNFAAVKTLSETFFAARRAYPAPLLLSIPLCAPFFKHSCALTDGMRTGGGRRLGPEAYSARLQRDGARGGIRSIDRGPEF